MLYFIVFTSKVEPTSSWDIYRSGGEICDTEVDLSRGLLNCLTVEFWCIVK